MPATSLNLDPAHVRRMVQRSTDTWWHRRPGETAAREARKERLNMANFNKVILCGNLTRDPQLRYLQGGMAVCDFGLAVNHKYRTKAGEDREEVLFVDCSCFGKGGEIINQYCQKGKPLLVEGRLRYETWDDKQGGGKRSKHTVSVDNFQLMGGRDDGGQPDVGGVERPTSRSGRAEQSGNDDGPPPWRQGETPAHNKPTGFKTRASIAARQKPDEPFGNEKQFEEADIPFKWEGRRQQPL